MKSKIIASLFAVLATTGSLFAAPAVDIIPASASLSVDTASDASTPGWTTLPNLVVSEKNNSPGRSSISSGGTLVLSAPSGFVFNTGAALSSSFAGGKDITSVSATVSSATTITITLTVPTTAANDSFTISGIQARPASGAPLGSGNIIRTSGTAVIELSGGSHFGTLTKVAGAAKSIEMFVQPSATAEVGEAFAQQPSVRLRDQFSHVASSDNSTVVNVAASSGSLLGTTSVAAVAGVVQYTNLAASDVGTITLQFSSGSLTPAVSSEIEVIAGAPKAAALVITTQPSSNANAGQDFGQQPVISVYDQYGTLFTNDNSSIITATRLDGSGDLQGTVTANVVNGVATFTDLSHNVAGDITIQFTSGTMSNAVSGIITVHPGAAANLVFTTQPGSALVNIPFGVQPVVKSTDEFGNDSTLGLEGDVEVSATLTSGSGNLNGSSVNIGTNGGNGIVSFTDLSIDTENVAAQITVSAFGLTSAESDPFPVNAVAATRLVIETQPSATAVAGEAFAQQPVIRLEDENGNLAASDSSTFVTVAASSGALTGSTSVQAVNGVVTFVDLGRNIAGTITLNFTASSLTGTTSEEIVVSPATATTLVFSTSPGMASAGSPFGIQPIIKTRDDYGNDSSVGLNASQIIDVALTSGSGALLGSTSADIGTDAGNGTVQFTDLQIDVAGLGKRLTATNDSLALATSAQFSVAGVEPANAIVSVDTVASGSVLLDGPVYYEGASGDVGTGTIILNAPAGFEFITTGQIPRVQFHRIAGPNTGGINGVNSGTHQDVDSVTPTQITFTITQSSSGGTVNSITWSKIRVRATTGNLTSGHITKSGTSVMPVVVDGVTSFGLLQTEAGAVGNLVIQTQPSSTANAGVEFPQQPVIELQDQFGNPLSDDNTTEVTVTANGSESLQGTTTATAVNGIVTFTDLFYNAAETITLTFTSGSSFVVSDEIVVGAGVADRLVFSAQPDGGVAGLPFATQPVVRTADAFGNFSTVGLPENVDVTIYLLQGTGPLSGINTLNIGTLAGNGIASFSGLQIENADPVNQLTVEANGFLSATGEVFAVIAADHLEFVEGDGQTGVAGSTLAVNPTVRVVDSSNAPVAGATVSFSVLSGGGSVGSETVISDTNGLASTTFTLGGVLGDSNQVLLVSALLPGSPSEITFYATATIGGAAQLSIQTQPSSTATAGEAFAQQPTIRIEDEFGNLIEDDNTTEVTVARNSGTSGLNGTLTGIAVNGIVTFADLSYNTAEVIDLAFTASGLTGIISEEITVGAAEVSALAFTTQPGNGYADSLLTTQPVVKSKDVYGNDSANGLPASLIVSLELTAGTGELLGTTEIDLGSAAGNGVAAFADLQVTAGGLNKELTATADDLTDAVSSIFRIGGVDPGISPIIPANGTSVEMVGPAYYEIASGDVGVGTIILNAPAGFEFDTGSTPVVRVKRIGGNGNPDLNINAASNGGSGSTYPVTVSASQLSFTVSNSSTNGVSNSLTWEGIFVRFPVSQTGVDGEVVKTGTSSMAAVEDGVTIFALLNGEPRPARLSIVTQPSANATNGVEFAQQPVVRLEDQYGNIWTNSSVIVTAARAAGSGNLQGTLSVQTVDGIATFTDLSHNVAGTITIQFTGTNLVSATSDSIIVSQGVLLSQTITFDSLANKTFNDAPFNVSATASSDLPVSFSIVSGPATISGNTVTITGAGDVTVRASQAGDSQYEAAPDVDRTFTVNKAGQTITFNALPNKTFGDAPFAVNATASSGLSVTFSIVSGPATISGNTVTLTGVGNVVVRASQGGNANYNPAPNADQGFAVEASLKQVKSDINGDDKADIIFQNGRNVAAWLGSNFTTSVTLTATAGATRWEIFGQGDFNLDGKQDLAFQDENGSLAIWFMNGVQRQSGVFLSRRVPVGWRAVSVARMNADEESDIVFQHADGRVAIWYMDGTNFVSSLLVARADAAEWRVCAAGDLDGDSSPDLLVQHINDNSIALWTGTDFSNTVSLPSVNSGWKAVGMGDLNQDDKADLLFRSVDGRLGIWFMDGTTRESTTILRGGFRVTPDWIVVGPR